jgi:UDP-N-acetylglucosamine 3-dehydrogenase
MRLVFLGCGKIARAHAKRLRKHKHHVTLGFASRDPERARAFASELGGEVYPSYEAAIASPDVGAVAVVTPPNSHLELTLAGLRGGKHVVLEKPPLLVAKQFDEVEAAARAAGRRVFVAENYQYKPLLRRMQDLLARNMIGEVLFVHINAIKLQGSKGPGWRDDPALAGGGALFEGGIHWVDFMANLGMPVVGVRGMRPALAEGAALERSMLVAFQYERAVGTLAYSWEVPSTAKGLRLSKIYGREGTITFETNGLWVLLHGRKTRFYVPGLRDLSGYHAMWADFVNAWTTDTEPLMTLAKARRDLELVEQAYATSEVT